MSDVIPAGNAAVITATGTLGAKDEVMLSFKIGGIVARVLVDDGATVRRGQVLAVLDQREIEAMVAKATAGAEKARRDAARAERLFGDSVVTLAQMQDAQTGRAAAEADLRTARVNHEFATIVAPAAGVVLARTASAGQLVSPGTPVIQFASRARGSVLRAGLSDRDAVSVKLGTQARVSFDAVPGRVFQGRVSQIGASADPRTGLYTVEVALEGVAHLPSGLVGKLTIGCVAAESTKGTDTDARPASSRCSTRVPSPGNQMDGVSAIPAEALVEGDGDRGLVYTVDAAGKRARRVAVTLVGLAGDRVLVRGLDGVARVVSVGATWLTDSARVEIKP
jgi:RND family efflux transporter MFP subunit